MKLLKKKIKGFTLIELLVAIAIIGILSTIVVVSVNGAKEKARDSKRKMELNQIAKALELYKEKYGHYPITNPHVLFDDPDTPEVDINFITFSLLPVYNPIYTNWIGCIDSGGYTNCDASQNETLNSFGDEFFGGNIPVDPINIINPDDGNPTSEGSLDYVYGTSPSGDCYFLIAMLENVNDSDACKSKHYRSQCIFESPFHLGPDSPLCEPSDPANADLPEGAYLISVAPWK